MLVQEYSGSTDSPHRIVCVSPTPPGYTSRASNTSTLDCSLVALDMNSDSRTPEIDDLAFCSPHVPVSTESNAPKEQFAVSDRLY